MTQKPNLKKVGGKIEITHEFSIDKVLEGHYYATKEIQTQKGLTTIHTVVTTDGEMKNFFGATIIDNLLAKIPLGCYVLITYEGKSKNETNDNHSHKFLLEADQEFIHPDFKDAPQATTSGGLEPIKDAPKKSALESAKGPWD